MDDIESNILEHEAQFGRFIDELSFELPGKDQSLGRDVAAVAAQGIIDRTVADQESADGSPLKELSPEYAKAKGKKYPGRPISVRTGRMMSLESVMGQVTVSPDEVEMRYGTGSDDAAVAGYFTEQGRPFYATDETIAGSIRQAVADALADHIRGA